jgi:type II secretory pathway component PulC
VLRLAVIALLVYAGVTLWYDQVEERLQGQKPPEQKERSVTPALEKSRPAPVEDDYRIILSRNIFKAALDAGDPSGPPASADDLEDLEETKLRLVLLGTVTGGKDDARAIIRDEKTKLEDLYQAGSEVQGAVVSRISRGKVVLQVNGREEILTIKDPESDVSDHQEGAPRAENRAVGKMTEPEASSGETGGKVPEAQPRRRISFRNTPQMVPAPEGEQPERQPLPDEPSPSDGTLEKGAEQGQ